MGLVKAALVSVAETGLTARAETKVLRAMGWTGMLAFEAALKLFPNVLDAIPSGIVLG